MTRGFIIRFVFVVVH